MFMNNIQQLAQDKYPDSEISHIERRAFEEGWDEAKKDNLKDFGNTLFISIGSDADKNGNFDSDFMLQGNAEKIGSALASQMQRHPELLQFVEYALGLYDNLMSHEQK